MAEEEKGSSEEAAVKEASEAGIPSASAPGNTTCVSCGAILAAHEIHTQHPRTKAAICSACAFDVLSGMPTPSERTATRKAGGGKGGK